MEKIDLILMLAFIVSEALYVYTEESNSPVMLKIASDSCGFVCKKAQIDKKLET